MAGRNLQDLSHGIKIHDSKMARPQLHHISHKCILAGQSFLAPLHPSHLLQTLAFQIFEHHDKSHPTDHDSYPFFLEAK